MGDGAYLAGAIFDNCPSGYFSFFRKEGFGFCAIEYGFIDGDYIVYSSTTRRIKISITYNLIFNIVIHKNKLFGQHEDVSLVLEKMKYKEYITLPEDINTEYNLKLALTGYLEFLKKYYFE